MTMLLTDIKTLQQISAEYNIPVPTLKTRLKLLNFEMIENVDFRRMGVHQGILFSPKGVMKITRTGLDVKKEKKVRQETEKLKRSEIENEKK